MRVENMTSARGNVVPNQFVITDGNRQTFQSYESTIIDVIYPCKIINIGRNWNYSVTTGKYRNLFFKDYADGSLYGLHDKKTLEKAIKDGEYNGYTIVMA